MKILILADPSASHTVKWVNSLSESGIDILLFGLSDYNADLYNPNIKIEIFKIPGHIKGKADGNLLKLYYLSSFPNLRKLARVFKPDIIHSHYASSYGLLGAMCGFHPFLISVWGNDVFDFPKKSWFHKRLFRYILAKSDQIFSTSHKMANEANLYTKKRIEVIPFGVDPNLFFPLKGKNCFNEGDIIIGTVKSLEINYGLEYLIKAFKVLYYKYPLLPIRLLIVGGGSLEKKLKEESNDLIQRGVAVFTGHIPYNKISEFHNMIDIAVFPSISESFGVSIIEASACSKPVVISDVGGMPEVIENNITGIKVTPANVNQLVWAIERLILDENLRLKMGENGRELVKKNFCWSDNVDKMISYYQKILND